VFLFTYRVTKFISRNITLREVSVGYWTWTSERKELLSIVQTTVGLPMTSSQRGTEA